MAMMRYVNATIKKVVKPEVKIVICKDSGLVEDEPTNNEPEEEDDERDSDGNYCHKTFDRAD